MIRIDLLDPSTGLKTTNYSGWTGSITRRKKLSAITKWSFNLPVICPVVPLLAGQSYGFEAFWQWNNETFNLGQSTYLKHNLDALGKQAGVEALGGVYDLTRQTILQRDFNGATDDVNDVLNEIVPLRSGWTMGDVGIISTAAPLSFWYETVLDGVALLAKTFGYHYREGATAKTLDFGGFGTESDIYAYGGNDPLDLNNNPDACYISALSVDYQSDKVVNQLIPFGGAVGVATIDLSEVTATQPGYTVQSAALPNGKDYYYIQDPTSIAARGLTSRRFVRSDLRPIVSSAAAREYAANILYEAALATLLNTKDIQTVYSLSITNLEPGRLDVGDRITVRYHGQAETDVGEVTWLDLDSSFYVLEMNETFSDSGVTTTLKINENAVHEVTVEDLLASTVRAFEDSTINVQPTVGPDTYGPYVKRIDTSVDAVFSFNLGPETLNLYYAKLRLTGEPLKSSVSTSEGGSAHSHDLDISASGAHTHTVTIGLGGAHTHDITIKNSLNTGLPTLRYNSADASYPIQKIGSAGAPDVLQSSSSEEHTHPGITAASETHTHNGLATDSESSHTHGMNYAIHKDTTYPNTLTIRVNGSIVASGVTLSAGNDYTYTLDITDDILAAANLQQEHEITVEAGAGQGEIQLQVQALKVIQPVLI